MSAKYLHIGIPVTNKKPGMIYNEPMKLWMTEDIDGYDYKIEYLKYEEGTPFPEVMHKNPHIAYEVDDIEKYIEDGDEVLFGPKPNSKGNTFAFIMKDNVIIELCEKK